MTAHATSPNPEGSGHLERHIPPRRRGRGLRAAPAGGDSIPRALRTLSERGEEARCIQGGALAGPEEDPPGAASERVLLDANVPASGIEFVGNYPNHLKATFRRPY